MAAFQKHWLDVQSFLFVYWQMARWHEPEELLHIGVGQVVALKAAHMLRVQFEQLHMQFGSSLQSGMEL